MNTSTLKSNLVPVITIDGPSGTGKGTVAQILASKLGWRYLDSGALYRCAAWAALESRVDIEDDADLCHFLDGLSIEMSVVQGGGVEVICQGMNISEYIRLEKVGLMASRVSSKSLVRKKLFGIQRAARQSPGLITDGRDMGTVVFPDSLLKFFLEASVKERANRRFKQLQQAGINVKFATIEADLIKRDERDRNRALSPACPAEDAVIIDTTHLSIDEVMQLISLKVEQCLN